MRIRLQVFTGRQMIQTDGKGHIIAMFRANYKKPIIRNHVIK